MKNDIIGLTFNRLKVISEVPKEPGKSSQVNCLCDCGKTLIIRLSHLISGNTKSCGCYHKERSSETCGNNFRTHGLRWHPLYKVWEAMKRRCYSKTSEDYKNYGGRGITVCEEWKNDFKAFYDWCLANGWKKGLTIERMDYDGNYGYSNCTFIVRAKQNRNKRNIILNEEKAKEIRNSILLTSVLAKQYKVSRVTIQKIRANKAWVVIN